MRPPRGSSTGHPHRSPPGIGYTAATARATWSVAARPRPAGRMAPFQRSGKELVLPEPEADRLASGEEGLADLLGELTEDVGVHADQVHRKGRVPGFQLSEGVSLPVRRNRAAGIGSTGTPAASSALMTWRAASPIPSSERK